MGATSGPAAWNAMTAADRQWLVIGRWQEYAGEARANLLRIAGIGSFYVIELINFHGLHLGPIELPASVDLAFHQKMTALAVAWTMMALATLVCLRLRIFPNWLKYATTLGDVLLLTTTLLVADGPRSPLVVGYFPILVLATLRFQLALVWCATLASLVGYTWMAWYGPQLHGLLLADQPPGQLPGPASAVGPVPVYYCLITLLAIALCGIVLGQVVRRVRAMADDYARRLHQLAGGGR